MLNLSAPNQTTPVIRRAFTLVELLVVIAIIAVLIALLLPALAGINRAGRKAATQNMMNALTNAASSFSNDNGSRMPGYFSEAQMGHSDNETAGMSAMENMLLELGGTDVVLGNYSDYSSEINEEAGVIAIAPFEIGSPDNEAVVVNTKLIGSSGAYFAPDTKFLKILNVDEGQQVVGNGFGQELMPDLVDSFDNPMLAWVQDTNARGSIDPDNDELDGHAQFASLHSDGNGANEGPAWFYLASNDCFIGDATANIGLGSYNQNAFSGLSTMPLNNNGMMDPKDRVRTLGALLASPSYYVLKSGETLEDAATDDIFPSRPRGSLIVHSAGADGYYLGTDDEGWRSNVKSGGGDYHIQFGSNYKSGDDRYEDSSGNYTTLDVIEDFDDIIQSVN